MKAKPAPKHIVATALVAVLTACGSPEDQVESGDEKSDKGQPVAESQTGGAEEESDPSIGEELKKAGGHLKEAGKVAGTKAVDAARKAGDLLERGLGRIEGATHETKEKLVEAYGDDLEEAKRRLAEWKKKAEGASAEQLAKLEGEIEIAREKLEDLKGATEKNWDAAKGAFGTGWEGLKGAFRDAKEEFEERKK